MVTGYEERGKSYWWVDRCTDGSCRPVFVASRYRGSSKENYHNWWRCLPKGSGHLGITRAKGEVRAGATEKTGAWHVIKAGDALAQGTYIRLGAHSEVRWKWDGGTNEAGSAKTDTGEKMFHVGSAGVTPVDEEQAPKGGQADEPRDEAQRKTE